MSQCNDWLFDWLTLIACYKCFDVFALVSFLSLSGLSNSVYKATLPYFFFFFPPLLMLDFRGIQLHSSLNTSLFTAN